MNTANQEQIIPKSPLILGGLVGGVTSIPLMALLFFGEQFAGLPFVPFDLFDWLARVLPGNIITPVIDFLVDLITTFNLGPTDRAAKQIEQFMALVIILIAGILLGVVIAWGIARTSRPGWEIGGGAGPILFLLLAVVESDLSMLNNPVTLLWLALTIVGWGALRRLLSH